MLTTWTDTAFISCYQRDPWPMPETKFEHSITMLILGPCGNWKRRLVHFNIEIIILSLRIQCDKIRLLLKDLGKKIRSKVAQRLFSFWRISENVTFHANLLWRLLFGQSLAKLGYFLLQCLFTMVAFDNLVLFC